MSGSTPTEGSAGDRSPSRPWRGWRARGRLPRGRWSGATGSPAGRRPRRCRASFPASAAAAAPPPLPGRAGEPRAPRPRRPRRHRRADQRRLRPADHLQHAGRPDPGRRAAEGHAHGGHRGGADRRDAGDDPDPRAGPGRLADPPHLLAHPRRGPRHVLPPLPGHRAVRQLQLPPRAHRDRLVRRPLLGGRALLRAQHPAQRLGLPGGEDAAPRGRPEPGRDRAPLRRDPGLRRGVARPRPAHRRDRGDRQGAGPADRARLAPLPLAAQRAAIRGGGGRRIRRRSSRPGTRWGPPSASGRSTPRSTASRCGPCSRRAGTSSGPRWSGPRCGV